jgi:superfamily I DNA/RNA helicase
VDEAQDLLRNEYLDLLDLSLKGGLGSGRWRMFGDFEKQTIYGASNLALGSATLKQRFVNDHVYSLRVNCRNTPRIAEYIQMLAGLDPGYSRVLRPDDLIKPEIHTYRDKAGQEQLLLQALDSLESTGYSGRDVVVLSPKRDGSSAASGLNKGSWNTKLKPYVTATAGQTGYCTIHSFKGMEAPAIIVTDIDRVGDAEAMSLFYIALTRALHRLVILVNSRVASELRDALLNKPAR